MSQPLAAGQARISLLRERAYFPVDRGFVVFVVAWGSNARLDTKIAGCSYSPTLANSDRVDAIGYFEGPPEFRVLREIGREPIARGWRVSFIETPVAIGPIEPKQGLPPNAELIGCLGSDLFLVFDQPPGPVQLSVVTIDGREAFAPEFVVEGGKRYDVSYHWNRFGVQFSIGERKTDLQSRKSTD